MKRIIEARFSNESANDSMRPAYATTGSAGLDLRACIKEPIAIEPGGRCLIGTGLSINMKDPSLVAIIASRSGLSLKHGIRVAQGVGIIDSDYHGEIGVILANDGSVPYIVRPGDRIAQLLFQPVVQVDFAYVAEFANVTTRGEGGFGSTGHA